MRYNQGFFIPSNKHKYIGDVKNIVYRSGLELNFFNYFDKKKEIIKWGSEEIVIKYFYSIDKKFHRYFPDVVVHYENKKGEIKKAIIEIKCSKEIADTIYCILNTKTKKNNIEIVEKLFKVKKEKIPILLESYKKPKKMTKKYIEYLNEVMKNIDKWIYAVDFCKKNGMEFYIFSEKDLK